MENFETNPQSKKTNIEPDLDQVEIDDLSAETCRQFGLSIRTARIAAGLSQEEVASRAGLDRTYISQVESGKRNVTLVSISKIADALGVDTKDLF